MPAAAGLAGLAGLTRLTTLVGQGGQPIGQVAGQRLQQPGQLLERGREGTGELGQQGVSGREGGQGRNVGCAQHSVADHPALDDQAGVVAGEIAQGLGHRAHVALDKGDGGGANQEVGQLGLGAVGHRQAHQRVLVDLVVAAGGRELTAEGGQFAHGQAPVLGQHGPVGRGQAVANLVDHRNLGGPRVVHRVPPPSRSSVPGRRHPTRDAASDGSQQRLVRRTLWSLRCRATGTPEFYGG